MVLHLILLLFSWVYISVAENVLVTGGAGFLGYHLSLRLSVEGTRVVVLDNFNNDYDVDLKKIRATRLIEKGVTVVQGDACDTPLLKHLFVEHSLTAVVHLAARTSIPMSLKDPVSYGHSNMECLMVLLQLLTEHKETHFVYASSGDTIIGSSQSVIPPPRNLYTALKIATEEMAISFCEKNGLSIVGVRPFSVYGPWGRPDSDIYKISMSLDKNTPLEIPKTSNGEITSRDYIYIDDVISGITAALKHNPKSCNELYNLGNGKLVSMETIVHLLEKELQKKASNFKYVPLPLYEMDSYPANTKETQDILGIIPHVTIEEGIKEFVKWFKEYYYGEKISYKEPDHSLRDKVAKDYIKQRNRDMITRRKNYQEKFANYLRSKGRPTAVLYKEKKFIKKEGKYYSGGDGKRVITSRNIREMEEVCSVVDECVGFTSDGKLKQYIGPEKQWSSRPGSSLYIADIDVCEAGIHNCYGNATCTYLGPAQFKCGCAKGWALVGPNHCEELYRKGHETVVEKEQRVADKVSGRNWKEFVGNAQFYSFKSRESPEGNMAYYPDAKGNVELLKQACMESYHCMGFNTNGLLKKIIRQPSKWKSSSGTLYVLDVDYCHMAFSCPRNRHCRRLAPGKYDCA